MSVNQVRFPTAACAKASWRDRFRISLQLVGESAGQALASVLLVSEAFDTIPAMTSRQLRRNRSSQHAVTSIAQATKVLQW